MKFVIVALFLVAAVHADVSELGYDYHPSQTVAVQSVALAPQRSYIPPISAAASHVHLQRSSLEYIPPAASAPIPTHIHQHGGSLEFVQPAASAPLVEYIQPAASSHIHHHAPAIELFQPAASAPIVEYIQPAASSHVHHHAGLLEYAQPAASSLHVHQHAPALEYIQPAASSHVHHHAGLVEYAASAPAHVHHHGGSLEFVQPAASAQSVIYQAPLVAAQTYSSPVVVSGDLHSDGYRYKKVRRVVYRHRK